MLTDVAAVVQVELVKKLVVPELELSATGVAAFTVLVRPSASRLCTVTAPEQRPAVIACSAVVIASCATGGLISCVWLAPAYPVAEALTLALPLVVSRKYTVAELPPRGTVAVVVEVRQPEAVKKVRLEELEASVSTVFASTGVITPSASRV
jgi:hypothetical protein